jgi:hypothetical protein
MLAALGLAIGFRRRAMETAPPLSEEEARALRKLLEPGDGGKSA